MNWVPSYNSFVYYCWYFTITRWKYTPTPHVCQLFYTEFNSFLFQSLKYTTILCKVFLCAFNLHAKTNKYKTIILQDSCFSLSCPSSLSSLSSRMINCLRTTSFNSFLSMFRLFLLYFFLSRRGTCT